MGSGPDINYPAQPTYGEGMADAMKAQMEMLTGTGDDFSKIYEEALGREGGSLQDILRQFEAPIRKETAQIDTDVLRQTILGGEQKVVRDPETGKYGLPQGVASQPVAESGPASNYVYSNGSMYDQNTGAETNITDWMVSEGYAEYTRGIGGNLTKAAQITKKGKEKFGGKMASYWGTWIDAEGNFWSNRNNPSLVQKGDDIISAFVSDFRTTAEKSPEEGGGAEAIKQKFVFHNPNVPADPSKAGQPGFDDQGRQLLQEGEVVREGTGMVDLLGDRRELREGRRLSREEQGAQLLADNPQLSRAYKNAQNDPNNPFYGMSREQAGEKLLADYGGDLDEMAKDFGVSDITVSDYGTFDTGRQAGFDEQGNFLGLAALAEDVQRGHMSRQRESDLMDVARLSGQYQDIMEDYKPGTQEALDSARKVLEKRKEDLTGGAITVPTDSTYGGDMDDVTAATAPELEAATAFGGELAAAGTDPLRQRLLAEAKAGLGEGLTARELRNIQEGTRAAATARGRVRDIGSVQQEVEARLLEDRNRQAMNRAFATQVLGQEAGLQTGDLGRGMQQEGMQADITQRRDLTQFGADVDRARMEQAQAQQAGQFDVGAKLDAERIGEQLKQSGTLGYIDAATRLAALEDRNQLDPFQAVLGRGGGGSLGAGQSLFGQAGYGLQSGPQYLNPEAGLGYISNMAANQASMWGAQQKADASRSSGLMGGLGAIGGGLLGNPNLFG